MISTTPSRNGRASPEIVVADDEQEIRRNRRIIVPRYDGPDVMTVIEESVFSGSQAELLDKYTAEDRYVGSLVGVRYAEAFKSRSPLLVADPEAFAPSRFG
jgi:hypothetical protein